MDRKKKNCSGKKEGFNKAPGSRGGGGIKGGRRGHLTTEKESEEGEPLKEKEKKSHRESREGKHPTPERAIWGKNAGGGLNWGTSRSDWGIAEREIVGSSSGGGGIPRCHRKCGPKYGVRYRKPDRRGSKSFSLR